MLQPRLGGAQERRLSPPVDPRRRARGACAGRCSSTAAWPRPSRSSSGCSRRGSPRFPDPETLKDAKTRLQEYLQARSLTLPRYTVLGIEGDRHAQTFRVSCEVAGLGRACRVAARAAAAPSRRPPSACWRRSPARQPEPRRELASAAVSFAAASPRSSAGPTSANRRCSTRSSVRNSASSPRVRRPPATASLASLDLPGAQIAFVDTPGLHRDGARAPSTRP